MAAMLVGSALSCSSRSLILFTFGCTLAVVLMTFQYEHKLLLFNSPRLMLTLPSLSLISVCGLGAGKYTNSDFYLKTCVPCLTFAGAILTIQITKFLSQNNQSLTSNSQIEQEHVKNE
ncbi:unnamed protein product [Rotaria sp. Silwood2]|nr:unnamed protein product [Rotaria sp. Silwood2]